MSLDQNKTSDGAHTLAHTHTEQWGLAAKYHIIMTNLTHFGIFLQVGGFEQIIRSNLRSEAKSNFTSVVKKKRSF